MDDDKVSTTNEPDKNQPGQAHQDVDPGQQPAEQARKKEVDQDSDQRFDFGGLPNRNLKKNLGCGG